MRQLLGAACRRVPKSPSSSLSLAWSSLQCSCRTQLRDFFRNNVHERERERECVCVCVCVLTNLNPNPSSPSSVSTSVYWAPRASRGSVTGSANATCTVPADAVAAFKFRGTRYARERERERELIRKSRHSRPPSGRLRIAMRLWRGRIPESAPREKNAFHRDMDSRRGGTPTQRGRRPPLAPCDPLPFHSMLFEDVVLLFRCHLVPCYPMHLQSPVDCE